MVSILLLEPASSGNVGGVARVMKNFECSSLILVNPKCDPLDVEARKRSMHGLDVLEKAKVVKSLSEVIKKFDTVVATTSRLGSDYNVTRLPLTPENLASLIIKRKKVALLFGREDRGLSNEEVKMCDFVVTIPASKKYAALNLVNAVTIMLYSLFNEEKKEHVSSHIIQASRIEKESLIKLIDNVLEKMEFSLPSKRETQKQVWRRIISKSFLTKRELFALCGFFKKEK